MPQSPPGKKANPILKYNVQSKRTSSHTPASGRAVVVVVAAYTKIARPAKTIYIRNLFRTSLGFLCVVSRSLSLSPPLSPFHTQTCTTGFGSAAQRLYRIYWSVYILKKGAAVPLLLLKLSLSSLRCDGKQSEGYFKTGQPSFLLAFFELNFCAPSEWMNSCVCVCVWVARWLRV